MGQKLYKVIIGISLGVLLSSHLMAASLSINVLSHKNNPIEDIVVYLLPLEQQVLKKNNHPLVIAQKEQAFVPYISVGQKGAQVEFRNDDTITHHIYSVSKGSKFNFVLKSKQHVNHQLTTDDDKDESEVVMGCNVHDWMGGVHLAVNTPYFAKTDVNGIATLDVEVSGKYSLVVWHPQIREPHNRLHQEVNVNNSDISIDMQLKKSMAELPSQENEDGFDYLSSN